MIAALTGEYPAGTLERLRELLPADIELLNIDTPEKYEALNRADAMILRIYEASAEDMDRIRGLKLISRYGVGYDTVDVDAASARGILVTNTPGSNAHAVSEHAVMLMLALCHHLTEHYDYANQGIYSNRTFIDSTRTLNNALVGLIGGGNIGRQAAKKVQAFGAKVQYYDKFRLPEETEKQFSMKYVSLDELYRTSDFISIHIPLTDDNYHMISEREISLMKPDAYLINTARGGLVDEEALVRAIDEKRLAGAGIDCMEHLPMRGDDPLLHRGSIIVTPHTAGTSNDIAAVTIPMLADTIMDLYRGDKVRFVVNKVKLAEYGYSV